MADVVISVVSKVAEYLVGPLIREGKYFFCINNFIGEIDNEKNELISERDNLMDRVEQAKQRAEEIEKPVEKWLSDVEILLKEVEDLDQRMKANKNCFQGRFPMWKRYHLCKQMVKKKEKMGKFKGKSISFQPISHRAPLPGIQYPPSETFTYFESTKVAIDQLLEALKDEKTFIIGVYGMGGSGKTTLVTEVGKKVEGMKMFDMVIPITISQNVNFRAVQGQIADALNVKLEEESESYRAQRLWMNLKQKGRLLIILDDVWSKFSLNDIGIKFDNESKEDLKIILTTRNQHICVSMKCQKMIHLGLLHEGESWVLFQKHANIDDKFSESLDGVPKQICRECKGLPIAIIAVGSSLEGRSEADWNTAFNILSHRDSIEDQEEGVGDALNCLKLSYDYLKDKNAKALFLMCSMFPEDYKISIEDLIRYAIGLGLGDMSSFKVSRDWIVASINRLLESCLLIQVEETKEYVKMHDMVRDTALWGSLNLSHATFEGIDGIQILSIIIDNNYGRPPLSLPLSIQFLTNLRTLCLNYWSINDISLISSLTSLEILDLQNCSFYELPKELGNIKRLKLLDLSNCSVLSVSYNGAIGRCLQLEELYLSQFERGSYYSQCVEDIITLPKLERFVSYSAMGIYHFKSSRILHVLDFDISKLQASKRNLLQLAETVHFEQVLGGFINVFPDMVRFVGGMISLKYLHLTNCSMIERIFDSPSDSEVDLLIPKLVDLVLVKLKSLKELIRGTPMQVLCFFEKLETLVIYSCPLLHNIFPRECNLQNLTIIKINNCKLGESLFSVCVSQSLHRLEELYLSNCNELKHIISHAREKVSNIDVESNAAFPVQSSQIVMPRLKKLDIYSCRNLVSTFPTCCFDALALFEEISIMHAPNLKLVFGECDHQCQIHNTRRDIKLLRLRDLENLIGICPEINRARWPSLNYLDVDKCPKLSASWIAAMTSSKNKNLSLYGFSELSMISRVGPTPSDILNLQCLETLEVGTCENLKYIFSMEMHRSLPELTELIIFNCDELEQIVLENEELLKLRNVEVCFPKLSSITINSCHKMNSLFSVSMVRMLPQLRDLTITFADKLEEVFRHDNGDNTLTEKDTVLPNLETINLKDLPSFVDICKGVNVKTPKLEHLDLASFFPKIVPNFEEIHRTPLPEKSKFLQSETEEYNDYEIDEDVEAKETHRDYDLDLS